MKRLLVLACLASSAAVLAAPAHAAPYCGTATGVNCTPDGTRFCRVWITATKTCVHT